MRIAFLYGTMHRGGAERVIASLANTFSGYGDDVAIITADNAPSGYALSEQVKHIRLDIAGTSRNVFQSIWRNIRFYSKLRKLIKKERYDAVIAFELAHAVRLQYAFPFGRSFKLIASERANPLVRRLGKLEKLERKWFLPKVDGFIFQTSRVSQCYSEKLRKKGTVIHNGVFSEILPEKITEFADRKHNDICAVGRLDGQKGYDVLLDAFTMFSKKHPEHHLHIYGEGPKRNVLTAKIEELELKDKVTLHGSVPNVMFTVENMGMFVMASRFEGMPNALMEAMACGLPCVSTDCDFGPGELIRDGENGLLVPVGDAEALCTAMERIVKDPALAVKLSENGRKIRQTHSGEKIAEQYHSYIQKVLGE